MFTIDVLHVLVFDWFISSEPKALITILYKDMVKVKGFARAQKCSELQEI